MQTTTHQLHAKWTIKRKPQQGFTLIEVLVALVVIAFGLVAVIQLTSSHIKNMSELEKRLVAEWVASNHLAEIRFKSRTERLRAGGDTERVKMGGHRWRSRAQIRETEVEKVFLVTVDVTDEAERGAQVYASLTTAVTDSL